MKFHEISPRDFGTSITETFYCKAVGPCGTDAGLWDLVLPRLFKIHFCVCVSDEFLLQPVLSPVPVQYLQERGSVYR